MLHDYMMAAPSYTVMARLHVLLVILAVVHW